MIYLQHITNYSHFRKLLVGIMATLCLGFWHSDASAISIKEEEQLAKEFIKVIKQQVEIVEDPLINDYVQRVGQKILAGLPPQPFAFNFYVIKEDGYNAFAIPAGHIFINSGLIMAMEREDELAGILSHEISHVVCRHISQRIERSKKIDLATIAGVVAGIFLGAASGDPAVAQSLVFGSVAAGQTAYLGFSRDDEMQADQLGLNYLAKAGYSAQGLLDVLQKIRGHQWFGSDVVPAYLLTHPAVEQRIVYIDAWMASNSNGDSPGRSHTLGPFPFRRVVFRLRALYADANTAESFFRTAAIKTEDAEIDYGYGLLLSRLGRRTEAEQWLRKALARKAMDPLLLSELGRIYYLDGRYQEALGILSDVVSLPGSNSEALFFTARTLSALGKHGEAVKYFETLIRNHRSYQDAYYYMGEAYSKLGNDAYSHYYLGLFYYQKGDAKLASRHLLKVRESIADPEKQEAIKEILEETRPKPGKSK